MVGGYDVGRCPDRDAINTDEDVAALHSRNVTGRARRHFDGRDAFGAGRPEHPVLDLVPVAPQQHVLQAQPEENNDGCNRKCGMPPSERVYSAVSSHASLETFGSKQHSSRLPQQQLSFPDWTPPICSQMLAKYSHLRHEDPFRNAAIQYFEPTIQYCGSDALGKSLAAPRTASSTRPLFVWAGEQREARRTPIDLPLFHGRSSGRRAASPTLPC